MYPERGRTHRTVDNMEIHAINHRDCCSLTSTASPNNSMQLKRTLREY